MANPFAESKTFHKIGHVTNTTTWKFAPTPAGLALLTTTGRKSGKQRQRAIRAVRSGDRVYAVALLGKQCAWLHNIRSNPEVRLKLGRATHVAHARIIDGAVEREEAAKIYRPVAGWYDYVDYANFVWSLPTRDRLLRVHDAWFERGVPVTFELQV